MNIGHGSKILEFCLLCEESIQISGYMKWMAHKYVPCLVCDPELRRKPKLEFLHPIHHQTHAPSLPQDHESYLNWVAEEYELDLDHEVFEAGGLTKPKVFSEFEHLFEKR
jgi:hypothetical protein